MRIKRGLLTICLILVTSVVVHPQQPRPLSREQILQMLQLVGAETAGRVRREGYDNIVTMVENRQVDFLFNAESRAVLDNDKVSGPDRVWVAILKNGPDRNLYETFLRSSKANEERPAACDAAKQYLQEFPKGNEERLKEVNKFLASCAPTWEQQMAMGEQALNSNPPRYADAETAFTEAKRLDPQKWHGFYKLGQVYEMQQKYDKAITEFEGALTLAPKEQQVVNALAAAYIKMGTLRATRNENAEALRALERAELLKALDAETYQYLGNVRYNLDRFTDAVAAFEKAIRLKPDDAQLRFEAGNAYQKLNRRDEALKSYNQALKLNPGFVPAADRLVELNPQDLKPLVQLADTNLKAKQYNKAEALYELFNRRNPDGTEVPVGYWHVRLQKRGGGDFEKVTDELTVVQEKSVILTGPEFRNELSVCIDAINNDPLRVRVIKIGPNGEQCNPALKVVEGSVGRKKTTTEKKDKKKFAEQHREEYIDFNYNNRNYVLVTTFIRYKLLSDDDYLQFVVFRKASP